LCRRIKREGRDEKMKGGGEEEMKRQRSGEIWRLEVGEFLAKTVIVILISTIYKLSNFLLTICPPFSIHQSPATIILR